MLSWEMEGKMVAAKRIETMQFGGVADEAIRSFKCEVQVHITKGQYINMAALLGYYSDEETMILVYEYTVRMKKP